MKNLEKHQNHGAIEEDIVNRSMQDDKKKEGGKNYITK